MDLTAVQLNDIIEWDVANWSKSLLLWEKYLPHRKCNCLELGARGGGLSLWLSLAGHSVICSDLINPEKTASTVHSKYNESVTRNISYKSIDATNIPFVNEFDIIVFKSILGGISSYGNKAIQEKTINNIYSALKPGGMLFFAENLTASPLHKIFRKLFVRWGRRWNYLEYEQVAQLFSKYSELDYISYGFFSAFGRNEYQRNILGYLDKIIDRFIKPSSKYIVLGVARK